jgi:hypothetical protein
MNKDEDIYLVMKKLGVLNYLLLNIAKLNTSHVLKLQTLAAFILLYFTQKFHIDLVLRLKRCLTAKPTLKSNFVQATKEK